MTKKIPFLIIVIFLLMCGLQVGNVKAQTYEFPWTSGNAWQWWTYYEPPWHGCNDYDCAIDIGTSLSDRRILSMAGGTITSICSGDTTADITINHSGKTFRYFHIDKASLEPYVEVDGVVVAGQVLGSSVAGNIPWDLTDCGYYISATQASNLSHLHWTMPKNQNLNVDGWVFNTSVNYAANGGDTKYKGDSFTSSNTPNYGVSTACGISNVQLLGETYYQTYFSCNALNTLTASNLVVHNAAVILSAESGGTITLQPGTHVYDISGQEDMFRAYIK